MDNCEWGREYLEEAARLRRHLAPLRRGLKTASGEEKILLYRRVSMLGEMYLELLHTGKILTERGEGK